MGITGSKSTESLDGYNENESGDRYYSNDGYDQDQFDDGEQGEHGTVEIPTVTARELAEVDHDNKIPMMFRWNHPAQEVWVAGTFTGWQKVRMHRSGHDFSYITEIPKGKHCYRFFVNDRWECAQDQPPVRNVDDGELYNIVDLTNFLSLEEEYQAQPRPDADDEQYTSVIPSFDDDFVYSTEPPHLPPHLRKIILNESSGSSSSKQQQHRRQAGGASRGSRSTAEDSGRSEDATELAMANHVTLNHLYCTAMKHGLMVLGTTFRYRQKCVTTVYYSVASNSSV